MRRQLTLAAIALSSMVVIAVLLPFALLVRSLNEDRAVSNAEQRAETLVPVLATFRAVDDITPVVESLNAGAEQITVILPDGRTIGAPATVTPGVELARQGLPFSSPGEGGVQVLIPVSVRDGGVAVVRTFVPEARLREGVLSAWAMLTALGIGLVATSAIVANRLARLLTQPVLDLATTAERLSGGDLSARVTPAGPSEVVKVGLTLNTLADRIDAMVASEREGVADLSHRLRTPVTSLRLDVDSLDPGPQRERLEASVDALARAVDRLIDEARRSRHAQPDQPEDLVAVVAARAAFWAVLAEEQERQVTMATPSGPTPDSSSSANVPAMVLVSLGDLEAMLDALLGNVFAHTPEGTAYAISLRTDSRPTDQEWVELIVDDAGLGWPDGVDVLARGSSEGGSTGLGLDIVRTTAERAGGSVTLSGSPTGGARVVVRLPISPA